MEKRELEIRLTYHAPKDGQSAQYPALRDSAKDFAFQIDDMVPDSVEKVKALNSLEEAVFWANAGIARRSR